MPGAYAHITLVNLAKETVRLEDAGVPFEAIVALGKYFKFCEMGAVSPDYPYLDLRHAESKIWADLMHYDHTGDLLKKGISLARDLGGRQQEKIVAWLFGYAAHVVADVTIHPVVELRVGPYAANRKAHRVCELNQDAYIFQRLNLSEVGRSEHLDTGIGGCSESPGSKTLNKEVAHFWRQMLSQCYPRQYADNEPDIDAWHGGFKSAVDVAEEGHRMPLFARHLAVNCGLTYPAPAHVDLSYIEKLATPEGPMHYDAIFDKALSNVVAMWATMGKAVYQQDATYAAAIKNWNLDTGMDSKGTYGYWNRKAALIHA